jgi:hypothetical protein
VKPLRRKSFSKSRRKELTKRKQKKMKLMSMVGCQDNLSNSNLRHNQIISSKNEQQKKR